MVFDGKLPMQCKKVCVIGAGMAGLAAARELRREGLAVTVLEQCGDVGGQWLYDPRTDDDDPLGAAPAPVRVHSSVYASLRLISPREAMGFSDFPFVPRDGRDSRRFPGHGEVFLYLKDFCHAFGLMDAVRLNTRVLRVAMAPAGRDGEPKWVVRSVHLGEEEQDSGQEAAVEEVFDAVVVATGHYSQPILPSIKGACLFNSDCYQCKCLIIAIDQEWRCGGGGSCTATLTLTGNTITQVRCRIVDRRLRGLEVDSEFNGM